MWLFKKLMAPPGINLAEAVSHTHWSGSWVWLRGNLGTRLCGPAEALGRPAQLSGREEWPPQWLRNITKNKTSWVLIRCDFAGGYSIQRDLHHLSFGFQSSPWRKAGKLCHLGFSKVNSSSQISSDKGSCSGLWRSEGLKESSRWGDELISLLRKTLY